jgi:tripartite-type tricarboxylate transporter receptor subunit TctC
MTFNLRAFIALTIATLTAITPALSHAAYPEQPIKMIVAYGAGGGTDIIARLIARGIEKHLAIDTKTDARIVVVNRPGAGGGIGFGELGAAPADGYTIGFINTPNVLTIPIERKSNFHWTKYDLLGNVVDDPGNFSVHADSPFKNLADLVAYARANPEKVTVGTTGVGSDDHLAMLMFERIAKVKLTHVPFKGAAEVHQAVVGKQITIAAMNIGEALQFAKGGSPLRNLGQMSKARTTLAPQLATFKEQGFDIVLASLRGLAAPQGLPPAVREALVRAIERTMNDPEFKAQAASYFAPLRYLAPAPYRTELKEAEASFLQLWKEIPWSEK